MRVFAFLEKPSEGVSPVLLAAVCAALLAVDFIIALRVRRRGVLVASGVFTGGTCMLPVLASRDFSDGDRAVWALFSVVALCGAYLLLEAAFRAEERKRARREKRIAENRRGAFTLPNRENTFIRDRLNTRLRAEEGEKKTYDSDFEETDDEGRYGLNAGGAFPDGEVCDLGESRLRLDHVRHMLSRLKAAPLSPSDRLETEEMSRVITLYATKNSLSSAEVRALNDCLSAVLKMTAKYAL